MRKSKLLIVFSMLLLAGTLLLFSNTLSQQYTPVKQRVLFGYSDFYQSLDGVQQVDEPIHPIPELKPLSPALQQRVALGRKLFNDPRLSANGEISCSTCHNLAIGGHDPRGSSQGILGSALRRNAPTVFNATFNAMQFWDGRAETLFEQAAHPVLNPKEMGSTWEQVVEKLNADPQMVALFSLYPQGITSTAIQDAIALFEHTLVTPDSPFDRYLKGDTTAITPKQKAGYTLFKSLGCISCHQGRNVGGTLFQRIGVYATKAQLDQLQQNDDGRFEVTGEPSDRLVFKVPSLRNIELTAPYFHDGSRTTLEDAVADMGRLQLGQELSEAETSKIISFLHSLTGIYKGTP